MSIQKGSIVEGKVRNITKYGAFVELPDGNTGLVHISEISEDYVEDVREFLKEDQIVKVKILSVSDQGGRISLSIKKAKERKEPFKQNKNKELDFEDKLMKFLKESDEKLNDFKKRYDSKRRS
ncbi:S1 RNA-binding domain-containing protein [Caldicellulosiruptoraceae bacterium PP1]